MREIDLDFQPRRPRALSVVLLAAGLLLGVDAWLDARALGAQLAELESGLAQAKHRAERIEAERRNSQPEHVFSADESKALRLAIDAIRVDWEGLYRAIDQAVGEDIALLAIRPSASGQAVQISGEARDMKAALAFVDALRVAPLAKIALLSHQVKQNDPQQPIIFEIAATWLTGS
jgi:Tfp pilus assembly protein PilN